MLSFIKRLLSFELDKYPLLVGIAIRIYSEERLINDIYSLIPNADASMMAEVANFIMNFRKEQGYNHILEYLIQPEQMKLMRALVEHFDARNQEPTDKSKKLEELDLGETDEETSVKRWTL